MKKAKFYSFIILVLVSFSISCCKKDKSAQLSSLDLHINDFIWTGLHNYYLWVDNVPDLSETKYANENGYNAFLNQYSDHEKFFYSLLYNYEVIDKWSWIVDDYVALEKQFQGITLSMGYEFGLAKIGNTNDVLGFVKYVVKGGPADIAGVKRGDIFIKVDNQQLTVSNYQSLLSGKNSYTLSFANISNHTIIPNNKQVTLTAVEVHENPIYMDTILIVNSTKIGYLVYNGFVSDYDIQLNSVFKYFKDQGIQQLILDLRYNPGGAVSSAIYLASMIYTTDTTKEFIKEQYNKNFQTYLDSVLGTGYSLTMFADEIAKTNVTPATPINSLNLGKVYIITTGNTASASELIISGLMPYIDVITIGTNTVGKYVASTTIKDYDQKGVLNPNHKWALQPIILKCINSAGLSDYVNGFTPTVIDTEYLDNLLPFGDSNETLLKATLNYINGNTKKSGSRITGINYTKIADSRDFMHHSYDMYFKIPLKDIMKYSK